MLRSNGSQLSLCASSSSWSRRQHAVGVADQHLEQVEFHAGQRHLLAVRLDERRAPRSNSTRPMRTRSPSRQPGSGLVRRWRRRRPPQHGADARQQLAELERLDHIVVGADLQAHDPVDRVAHGRHHDHRHAEMLAHTAQDGDAVLAGHAQVEQDQIDRPRGPRIARKPGPSAAWLTTKPCSCRYSATDVRRSASSSTTAMWCLWSIGLSGSTAPRRPGGTADLCQKDVRRTYTVSIVSDRLPLRHAQLEHATSLENNHDLRCVGASPPVDRNTFRYPRGRGVSPVVSCNQTIKLCISIETIFLLPKPLDNWSDTRMKQ